MTSQEFGAGHPGTQLLDRADQAVIVTGVDRKITYWNQAAERLYGWAAEEVLGKDILEVTPAEPHPAQRVLDPVQRGGSWAGEFLVRRKDGTTFPAFVTIAPMHDEKGAAAGVIGLSFDLSTEQHERRRRTVLAYGLSQTASAPRVLGRSFLQVRGLAQEVGVAVGLVALATLARLGLDLIAPGAMPFTAYFPAVLLAAVVGGWRAGALASVLAGAFAWLLFPGTVGSLDLRNPLGLVNLGLYTAAAGVVVTVGAYVRELVERLRQNHDMLAERNLHYDALFEAMSEGFALCEAIRDDGGALTDYRILEMNPALLRMLGVGPEAVGTKLSDSPGDRQGWLELCDRVLTTGRPEAFESHNRRAASWHEIHVSRVTETRMAQFFFDITERKAAELRQGQLFDELNHRVKNNLTLVSGLLQMQARTTQDGTVREQLSKAVDRVQSIAQVHSALYQGARRDDVDFGAYLQDLCASLAQSLIGEDRIALEVEASSVALAVDTAIPLGMIVNELVTNAVKYAYPAPKTGAVSVHFSRDDEGLLLCVGDSGEGLPGDPEGQPGSLGMRLVNSLVAQVQGQLTVRHHPGATFEIRLPVDGGAPT